ncbi:MAG: DUF4384 domain-containing protein [Agarilytica sp.]
MSLSEDAWLYLYYENADGKVYQLIPSILYKNNHVKEGDFIEFPASNAPFEIKISQPFGKEHVWLLASNKALDAPPNFNINLDELPFPLKEVKRRLKLSIHKKKAYFAEDEMDFTSVQAARVFGI